MRLVAATVLLVLALPARGSAHPAFQPGFAADGADTRLVLTAPNERAVPMTAIELTAPPGLSLVAAESAGTWHGSVSGQRASWAGGTLPPGASASFPLRLRPGGEPGTVTFRVTQRFADGRAVRWPLALTVTPGSEPNDGDRAFAAPAVAAAAVALALALVWLRRRRARLQER